jgi:predicted cupin superfamily sugar epimerase
VWWALETRIKRCAIGGAARTINTVAKLAELAGAKKMEADADAVIHQLGLQPHPEGGWYRETWRAQADGGARSGGTAIHYLLKRHQRSHWHRVDATELWLYQAGGPLRLRIVYDGHIVERRLGPDILAGELLQVIIPPGAWQAADTQAAWALAACVVVPGFEFANFELAPPDWEPIGGLSAP